MTGSTLSHRLVRGSRTRPGTFPPPGRARSTLRPHPWLRESDWSETPYGREPTLVLPEAEVRRRLDPGDMTRRPAE